MLSSQGLPELDTAISIVIPARLNWVYIACSVLFQGLSVDRLVSHHRPVLEALTLFDRCGTDSFFFKKKNLSVLHGECRNPGLQPQRHSRTMNI